MKSPETRVAADRGFLFLNFSNIIIFCSSPCHSPDYPLQSLYLKNMNIHGQPLLLTDCRLFFEEWRFKNEICNTACQTTQVVTVDGETVGSIGKGLLILFGAGKGDTEEMLPKFVDKITKLRIFSDENDKINLSLLDVGGELLVVSQFTLYADCHKGNPSKLF